MLRKLIGVILVAAIGLALFEYISPKYFGRGLQAKAGDVAYAGAHKIFTERDSQKPFDQISADAHKASEDQARSDGVTLIEWKLDAQSAVNVTIGKQAPSLVLKHWNGGYDQITRKAVVSPQ